MWDGIVYILLYGLETVGGVSATSMKLSRSASSRLVVLRVVDVDPDWRDCNARLAMVNVNKVTKDTRPATSCLVVKKPRIGTDDVVLALGPIGVPTVGSVEGAAVEVISMYGCKTIYSIR